MILSDLEMEVGHAQEKDSGTRGEDQHLTEAVASVFLLPGFEKRIPKVNPSIGILRGTLEDRSECGVGLFDVLFLYSDYSYLSPSAIYQRRVVAE